MNRVFAGIAIALAVALGSAPVASADDATIRAQCRDSAFRLKNQSTCSQFYGGLGPARGGGSGGPRGGGLLGTIGDVVGGLTGGLTKGIL